MCKQTETNFIKEQVNEIKETIHFFSNKRKPDREVWVVRRFLSQIGIAFSNEELYSSLEEPVDVVYHDARFQVKEIQDENRKRGNENKELLRKAETATSNSDLLEPYQPPQRISCFDIVPTVAELAFKWQRKYGPNESICTDLIFYFNLQNIYVAGNTFPAIDNYSSKMTAWRSVSVCSNDCALVLHISQRAPDFLKTAQGKVHRNPSAWLDS